MHEWLVLLAESAVVAVNMMALLLIAYGAIEAFIMSVRSIIIGSRTGKEFRFIYMRFARLLIGGLTFQLAADVIETAIADSWENIGRLAAIAVVRTFLSYFLERDAKEIAEGLPEAREEEVRK